MKRHLTFRCARCSGVTQAVAAWRSEGTPAVVRCSRCGHRYVLHSSRPRQRTDRLYYLHVKSFAERKRLDLATAYSVCEGILPLDEARRITRQLPTLSPSKPTHWAVPFTMVLVLLTGGIGAYAMQVWSLQPGATPLSPVERATANAAVVREAVTPDEPRPVQTLERFELAHRNAEGTLVLVSATDPAGVLRAFCNEAPEAYLKDPIGLAPAPPPETDIKLGVYRDRNDLSTPMVIRIYKDARSGRWLAGDGRAALDGIDGSDLLRGAEVTPVVTRLTRRAG